MHSSNMKENCAIPFNNDDVVLYCLWNSSLRKLSTGILLRLAAAAAAAAVTANFRLSLSVEDIYNFKIEKYQVWHSSSYDTAE